MKIEPLKLGFATAAAFFLLWIVCSATLMIMPFFMQHVTAIMVHIGRSEITGSLSWSSMLLGGVSWAMVSGITVICAAALYDWISTDSPVRLNRRCSLGINH